ncbi:MAG: biopolymer transporter ExbD [Verrucomicrobia bacterium]|nr:MAG: biopolymer transporter ExbD [Verrucomicrobiota bacterium]TAE88324.1 MAG: biopolymer transporter ExbD [Verrucomicrobiota bacterium]TAF26778.1 MAG: biopolymer transporter ExbD [Verrucomicrobiota bacterium]TAF42034.1 MAG: biopolymer transporter ExbD [Verrucomicrobiota bacterium]
MASSKLRNSSNSGEDDCKLDMSPMIDMVFLLLMFFLVNATVIVVKQDPNVTPPVAVNSRKAEEGNGRIVVNVYEDGKFTTELKEPLDDEDAITELVRTEKDKIDKLGYKPKLHLRGDKDTVFKYSRQVIRAAAKAQVDQVVFAVYVTEK